MRIAESIFAALLLPATIAAKKFTPASTTQSDAVAAIALQNVIRRSQFSQPLLPTSLLPDNAQQPHPPATYGPPHQPCTLETARVRREWDSLSRKQKRSYIDALLCFMEKPAISGDAVPGARSRYDDFLGTHINQTIHIHGTGNFLFWHRLFIWAFEEALRNECGYQGSLPYINWPRYAHDLYNAPIFDGSDTSLSGNGAPISHNGTYVPNNFQPLIYIPPGRGGGCVDSGPFQNMTVRLGPVAPAISYAPKNPRPDGLGHNPRCLRRDISAYAAHRWSTDEMVTDLILRSPDIATFQTTMQGDFAMGFLGVHTAGHFFVGGDPGGDLFASAGDTYFYVQHAQIDRLWWMWQHQCPADDRIHAVGGTVTLNNSPPSRNATLDDVIDLGVNGGSVRLRDVADTMAGPFCYVYE